MSEQTQETAELLEVITSLTEILKAKNIIIHHLQEIIAEYEKEEKQND